MNLLEKEMGISLGGFLGETIAASLAKKQPEEESKKVEPPKKKKKTKKFFEPKVD